MWLWRRSQCQGLQGGAHGSLQTDTWTQGPRRPTRKAVGWEEQVAQYCAKLEWPLCRTTSLMCKADVPLPSQRNNLRQGSEKLHRGCCQLGQATKKCETGYASGNLCKQHG